MLAAYGAWREHAAEEFRLLRIALEHPYWKLELRPLVAEMLLNYGLTTITFGEEKGESVLALVALKVEKPE